jgi:hypothetical protein
MSVSAGFYWLPVWLFIGAGSVILWCYSEARGAGDLRFYAAVQAYAALNLPVLLLRPPRYTSGSDFGMVFGFYVLAKIFETADRQIFSLDQHAANGHTPEALGRGHCGFLRLEDARGETRSSKAREATHWPGKAGLYILQMMRPATTVAIGAPWKVRASKGELRDLLGDCFTS